MFKSIVKIILIVCIAAATSCSTSQKKSETKGSLADQIIKGVEPQVEKPVIVKEKVKPAPIKKKPIYKKKVKAVKKSPPKKKYTRTKKKPMRKISPRDAYEWDKDVSGTSSHLDGGM